VVYKAGTDIYTGMLSLYLTYYFSPTNLTNLQIRKASHEYLIPSQTLSYDEQMIACRGKSMHKIKAKHKPIKEGYQMFSLSDAGYVIDFLFHSLHGRW
jgi:hypothetical protein